MPSVQLSFTPTINSIGIAYARPASAAEAAACSVEVLSCPRAASGAREGRAAAILSSGVRCYSVTRALPEDPRWCEQSPDPTVSLQLFDIEARGGAEGASRRAEGSEATDSDASEAEGLGGDSSGVNGSAVASAVLRCADSVGFHRLHAGRQYAIVVRLQRPVAAPLSADLPPPGSVLCVGGRAFARVVGAPRQHRRFPLLGPVEETIPVEVVDHERVVVAEVALSKASLVASGGEAGETVVVINLRTLASPGLPPRVARNLLLPSHTLGPWLLGMGGNYAYAANLGKDFFAELLRHGLFVLPADSQIFSCPFPVEPFVFKLQESVSRRGRANPLEPGASWRRCKMLRRYGKEFELSCNADLAAHMRRCHEYHEAKGGSWMSPRFVDAMMEVHRDEGNGVKVYSFELWDRRTGELSAASFGLAIGSFFHDFSMCCLAQDRRSSGAILSKAIGALLADCGVSDWYWGCRAEYMKEYDAHGAQEISRAEYYARLRRAISEPLHMDPEDAVRQGLALIAPRPLPLSPRVVPP